MESDTDPAGSLMLRRGAWITLLSAIVLAGVWLGYEALRSRSVADPGNENAVSTVPLLEDVWVAPYEDFVALRSQYGFPTSPADFEALSKSDPTYWVFGVPMTKEESLTIEGLATRSNLDNEILVEMAQVPGFAGSALDANGRPGTLRIFGTKQFISELSLEAKTRAISAGASFVEVDMSLIELEKLQRVIIEEVDNNTRAEPPTWVLVGTSINYTNNAVDIKVAPFDASAGTPINVDDATPEQLTSTTRDAEAFLTQWPGTSSSSVIIVNVISR